MKIARNHRIAALCFEDNAETGTEGEGTTEVVFELPEDLSTLSADELTALHDQAVEAFDTMRAGELSTEVIDNLEQLAQAIEAIDAETDRRENEAATLADRATALAAQVHGDVGGEGEGADGTEGGEGEGGEGEGDTEGGESTEAATGTEGAATETEGAPAEGAEGAPAEVVTASAKPAKRKRVRVPLGAVGAQAPAVELEAADRVVITAAADIPGVPMGTHMDTLQVARAMHARARNLVDGGTPALVASIHHADLGDDLTIRENDTVDDITRKLNFARQPEALVAAGGWCTPSQFMYDLFSIEGTDGLIDLPTVNIDRGGIQFVENGGPSIADVWAAPWLWTEANDIAAAGNPHVDPDDDVTKPCVRVPCPEWIEERLDAHGLCVTHGNLADRAYPEMTRRFLNLVMAAHQHIISTRLIVAMQAESDAVAIAATFGAASAYFAALDLQAQDYRDKFRMDDNAVLEAVVPRWIRGVIRADISRRNGVDIATVTNAQIAAEFVARQVRPQFVYNYQPLQTPGGDGFREVWPDSVETMLYAAGTFVRGNGGSIDLTVARDSVQNPTNDHTVAFTEEFILLAKMGHESRKFTVPLEPNGATGGQVAVAAIGA